MTEYNIFVTNDMDDLNGNRWELEATLYHHAAARKKSRELSREYEDVELQAVDDEGPKWEESYYRGELYYKQRLR